MKLPFILAKRFVAGQSLPDAIPAVKELNAKGLHVTLDLLGEYVKERHIAEEATNAYIHLLEVIADERDQNGLNTNISVKLSMMGQKIDEDFCRQNLTRLLQKAKETDIFVRLDMEGTDITDSTFSFFEEFHPQYPDHVGIVLQAYLKRTEKDIARTCEMNARVRICKGAYGEPAELAYQKMSVIREHYMAHAKKLILDGRYPGIATHDDELIDAVKAFVKENNISHDDFEFQMLYGMRTETQEQLAKEGYNMRVYVPYGTEWLPYFTRRLKERKENIWFVLRTMFQK